MKPCLKITIGYGDLSTTPKFQLVDQGMIMETYPEQRNLKIHLADVGDGEM